MGLGLDMQGYTSTSSGAGTFVAATNLTGSIPNIRNFAGTDYAKLVGFSRKGATAGTGRIRSALMHDDVNAIRARALAGDPSNKIPHWVPNLMFAQDTPIVDGDGTSAEVEAYTASIFYSNLPGVAARLHSPADVMPLIDQILIQQVTITAVVPPGIATALITSLYNNTKANRDYAVLGFINDANLAGVGIQGADTGNLVCGFGVEADHFKSRDLFLRASQEFSLPLVPVLNAANFPSTNLVVMNDIAAASTNVGIVLGLLRSNITP